MEVKDLIRGARFDALVRNTGLLNNPALHPYSTSEISLELMEVSTLRPLAKYVLSDNLRWLGEMRPTLLSQGVDIFQLMSRIELLSGNEKIFIAPPIIEEWPNEGRLIVDGLHRLWLARSQGIRNVSCVFIRNVSLPLVPLPVRWEDVKEYGLGEFPAEKRDYRFNTISDIAFAEQAIDWGITEENVRYFFYRDLSHLGSLGIRQFQLSNGQRSDLG